MFGDNPIRKVTYDPTKLALEEVFYTLQGEGPYAGRPALFIRLAGCNLACTFCDTEFETKASSEPHWHQALERCMEFPRKQREFVVLTGGEPLRQNATWLVQELLNTGTKLVQVETAGTLWQPELYKAIALGQVELVCSPKTKHINADVALWCHNYKYIIKAGEVDPVDGLPNMGTQRGNAGTEQRIYRPTTPVDIIWLSPCDEYDPVKNKANQDLARDLCLQHGYRLSLQTHKIVGVA
jgi:7-carboxy-7-deazaguanine synthase